MLFYLSGAIEYSADHGRGWRAQIAPLLWSLGQPGKATVVSAS